jgi:hypothetical protein
MLYSPLSRYYVSFVSLLRLIIQNFLSVKDGEAKGHVSKLSNVIVTYIDNAINNS